MLVSHSIVVAKDRFKLCEGNCIRVVSGSDCKRIVTPNSCANQFTSCIRTTNRMMVRERQIAILVGVQIKRGNTSQFSHDEAPLVVGETLFPTKVNAWMKSVDRIVGRCQSSR